MTHFMFRFIPRSTLALLAALLPFSAAADSQVPYTVISTNTPEKLAALAPLVIDRSGLAVAPRDLRPRGTVQAEFGQDVARSQRPMARIYRVADVVEAPRRAASAPHGQAQTRITRQSTRTGFDALSRDTGARPANRARPAAPARTPRVARGQTAPAPSYLLGVFR